MTYDPARAYRQLSIQSASPIGLIVLLFNSALSSLHKAEKAAEAGEIESRVRELNHVLDIVAELRSVLDFERGGDVARQFDVFYRMVEVQILKANIENSPVIIQDLISHFVKIRDAWQQVDGTAAAGVAGQRGSAADAAAAGSTGYPAASPQRGQAFSSEEDAPRPSGRWSA